MAPLPLVVTKITTPRLRSDCLRRPRLTGLIHAHIERKLILVSAPAGYGKTSLLIDYAHDADLPVCWYGLDPSDNDARLFLEYLIASIERQFPGFGIDALALLREGPRGGLEPVVNLLINEIQEQIHGHFVLIWDDFQEVADNFPINALVSRFLRYLPENCHLILSTRVRPSHLPLTALAAHQQMVALGAPDLCFTVAEIRKWAEQSYHIALSDEQAAQVVERSEGWIASIVLNTQVRCQDPFQPWRMSGGDPQQVFDYLADEVFAQQPTAIQAFLARTAILREFTPAWCDALLDCKDSAATIQALLARNLFITRLEGPESWYRYHPLFRQFLTVKLRAHDPDEYQQLHTRAGCLARAEGRWDTAIYHFQEAERWDLAVDLLETIAAEVYEQGQWQSLTRWLDALPVEVREAHPTLQVWRAKICVEMEDLDEALRLLHAACQALRQSASHSQTLATALVERGSVRNLVGDHQGALEDCREVLAMGEPIDPRTIAIVHRVMGTSYLGLGDLAMAAAELEQSLALSRAAGYNEHEGCLYHNLGTTYELMGDIETAAACFQQALSYYETAQRPWALANTLNSIGVSQYHRGDYDSAQQALQRALDLAHRAGYARTEAYTLASLGDLHRDQGDLGQAVQEYREGLRIAQQVKDSFIKVYLLVALGDVCRLQGRRQQAHDLIRQAFFIAESHHSDYECGLCRLAMGTFYADIGEAARARGELEQALTIFERSGARREWARTILQIANLDFLSDDVQKAMVNLARALDVADQIGSDQFLRIDGQRLLPLYRYALRRRVGMGRLTRVRDDLQRLSPHGCHSERLSIEDSGHTSRLQVFGLGPGRVLKDGRLLDRSDWGSAITRELFFYLIEHRQPFRREEIIELLWPDLSRERASSNFHSTAYRLRQAIAPNVLRYEDGLYRFDPDLEFTYDVERFEELVTLARQPELGLDQQAQFLEQAIGMYQGEFFSDCYSDWCIPKREDLQQIYVDALFRLGRIYERQSDLDQAAGAFEEVLKIDNLREDAYVFLMRICAARGDQQGIKHWYRRCHQVLAAELGVEPLAETTRLYQRLLQRGISHRSSLALSAHGE